MKNENSVLGRQRVILQSFKYRNGIYSEESIPCRHEKCTQCPHGRYWYLRIVVKGKKETFYLGGALVIVSWEAEGLPGLTFEELFRRRKLRREKRKEKELQKDFDTNSPKPKKVIHKVIHRKS